MITGKQTEYYISLYYLSIRLGLLGPTLGLSPTGGRLNNDSVEYDAGDAGDEYAFDEESEYFNSEPLTALTDPFTETQQV